MYEKVKFVKEGGKTFLSSACQCCFPHVFEAWKSKHYPDSKAEYSVTLLIDPKDPFATELKKQITKMMSDTYGSDKELWPDGWKNPLKRGDKKKDKYPEMAGMLTLKCNNKTRKPLVVDASKKEILDTREIYGGAYVRARFDLYQMENGFQGVGCGLRLVQKLADAEPFGGARGPETVEDLPELDLPANNASSDAFDEWGD